MLVPPTTRRIFSLTCKRRLSACPTVSAERFARGCLSKQWTYLDETLGEYYIRNWESPEANTVAAIISRGEDYRRITEAEGGIIEFLYSISSQKRIEKSKSRQLYRCKIFSPIILILYVFFEISFDF